MNSQNNSKKSQKTTDNTREKRKASNENDTIEKNVKRTSHNKETRTGSNIESTKKQSSVLDAPVVMAASDTAGSGTGDLLYDNKNAFAQEGSTRNKKDGEEGEISNTKKHRPKLRFQDPTDTFVYSQLSENQKEGEQENEMDSTLEMTNKELVYTCCVFLTAHSIFTLIVAMTVYLGYFLRM